MKYKIFAVLLSMFTFAQSAQANLLTNSGFETGDFSGWAIAGDVPLGYGVAISGQRLPDNVDGPAYARVHGGTYTAWATTRATYGEALKLSQTLDLDAGIYSTGFYFQSSEGIYGNHMHVYVDGNDVGRVVNYITASSQMASFNFALAGGGPHTIEFDIGGSGTGPVSISVDDFFLNFTAPVVAPVGVPEPNGLALMAAGILALAVLRQKKRM